MLYILPLEPLTERYSIQWNRWFKIELIKHGIAYRFIDGDVLTDHVETGQVLDAEGTCYWKLSQMQRMCQLFKRKEVKEGDKFFTFDVWQPGLECIPYMAQLEGIKVDIYGFLHAGSYTKGDFAESMASWARWFEIGWMYVCKKVFVGSKYHKCEFSIRRQVDSEDIVVTGNPFSTEDIRNSLPELIPASQRKNIIAFPHRWDRDKDPERFAKIMLMLREKRQDFIVRITTGRKSLPVDDPTFVALAKFPWVQYQAGLSKSTYYESLAESKVFFSSAIAEHFGYCLAEAVTLGCSPVVTDLCSHPEMLQYATRCCLYNTDEEAVEMLCGALDTPIDMSSSMERFNGSVERILSEMGCI